MNAADSIDFMWMAHAISLAEQGLHTTQPNPRVGCVIVKNNQIVGQGAHLMAGDAHAEIFALREAGALAQGSDIYVTLEPCSHFGRTPPCVQSVLTAKPKRVIVAMQDPNPLVAGRGIAALREQGVEVTLGVLEKEALALNPGFVSRMKYDMPYVRSKIATSLDGRTALNNGKSQWITSEESRRDVQLWRARSCAILTGVGTVLLDNPSMIVRLENTQRQPLRVIVDSHLQTPAACKMLDAELIKTSPVLIAYVVDKFGRADTLKAAGAQVIQLPADDAQRVDLRSLMKQLVLRQVNEVLVEAGQMLNGALLHAGLVDEFIFYYAPKLMGAHAKAMFALPELTEMQQVTNLHVLDIRQIGSDIRMLAKPTK
jgi:diaminohydroxyphosphoribosylaminopyrimidine deaminase/5-amino-6-(5-phosphoribosylamino)uracil reductase